MEFSEPHSSNNPRMPQGLTDTVKRYARPSVGTFKEGMTLIEVVKQVGALLLHIQPTSCLQQNKEC